VLKYPLAKTKEMFSSFSWQSVIWSVNGFFLLTTVIISYFPESGSASRQGVVQYLAQLSLANEKTLATYWEGWCLLLIAVLAFERFFQTSRAAIHERRSWIGLAILGAGLSLDELASIHERSSLFFSSWGLSGSMSSKIPLAVPVLMILIFSLQSLWRLAGHRYFWMTLSAFVLFGSVAFQEHLEFAFRWPWWTQGIRVGIEEGTELLGVFFLLSVVVSSTGTRRDVSFLTPLFPAIQTLIRLRPVVAVLTLAGFVPLGIITALVIDDATHRGIPAAWLPFMLLNLAWIAAWACAQKATMYSGRFLFVGLVCLLLSLDQIVVFERVLDKNLIGGALITWILPGVAIACLSIPTLRTPSNVFLIGGLLLLSLLPVSPSELFPWLVIPLQSLAILWVLTSGLMEMTGLPAKQHTVYRPTLPTAEPSVRESAN
jgi:hypothetical protein